MRIHQVVEEQAVRHEIDPIRGHVVRHDTVLKQGTTHKLKHEGVEYERADDGSFDLPDEVAPFFLGQPGWYEGTSPFADDVQPDGHKVGKGDGQGDEKPKPAAKQSAAKE